MLTGLLARKITIKQLLRNWLIVYLANFAGGVFVAGMLGLAGSFAMNGGLFGTTSASIATAKISLGFGQAFILGLLCNLLVCLAVWLAVSAQTVPGKVLAIIFPIATFVICGFEHSIANMYYLPAGFFASGDYNWLGLLKNLVPVTLGNIVGGGVFIACAYHFALNNAKISICKKSQLKKSSSKKKSSQKK